MAAASLELIDALRNTAKRIGAVKSNYDWKNIGACNCGNLVQVITGQDKKQIHHDGIQKHGDWEMLVYLYKEDSNFEIDRTIKKLVEAGLSLQDIVNLENLSDPAILGRLPEEHKYIKRDKKEDVVLYLEIWADMLEEELLAKIDIKELETAGLTF